MNKKKIIWGIVIVFILAIIVWIDIPYLFHSKNLISKNNYDYTYRQEKPESIEKYYKIQEKEFDIKKIIEELQ